MVHAQVSLGGLLLCLQVCHSTIIIAAEGPSVLGWLFQYECSKENPQNQTNILHTAAKIQYLGKRSSCHEIEVLYHSHTIYI